jgi:hypothetical protein
MILVHVQRVEETVHRSAICSTREKILFQSEGESDVRFQFTIGSVILKPRLDRLFRPDLLFQFVFVAIGSNRRNASRRMRHCSGLV